MEAASCNNAPLSPTQGYHAQIRGILEQMKKNRLLQDVAYYDQLVKPFKQRLKADLDRLAEIEKKLVSVKLIEWKKKQTRLNLYGFHNFIAEKIQAHSASLDNLQIEYENLAVHISNIKTVLKRTEQMIEHEIIAIGNFNAFAAATNAIKQLKYFVQKGREDLKKLWDDLINNCVLVETQPPPIYDYSKKKFTIDVKIRLLCGNLLYSQITNGRISVFSRILVEDRPNDWTATDMNGENVGEIIGKYEILEEIIRENKKRITFYYKNAQLKIFSRDGKANKAKQGTTGTDERVMEKKMFLEFECRDTMKSPTFQVLAISLPFVVISHWTQEWQADAAITWDRAFRTAECVPKVTSWSLVAELLQMKCLALTAQNGKKHELTKDNMAFLKNKVLSTRQYTSMETISLAELSREKLTQPIATDFSFWQWFHGALKLISKEENQLRGLWNKGLIIGFIERETAERILVQCLVGTFLLRFADSCTGIITIAVHYEQGLVRHSERFDFQDLKRKNISMYIKEQGCLKYLYQPHSAYPSLKDEIFKEFYDNPETATISPYIGLSSGPSNAVPLETSSRDEINPQGGHSSQMMNSAASNTVPMTTDTVSSPFPTNMPSQVDPSQMAHSNPIWSNMTMDTIAAYGSSSTGMNFMQESQPQTEWSYNTYADNQHQSTTHVTGPFDDLLVLHDNLATTFPQTLITETSHSTTFPWQSQGTGFVDIHGANTGDTDMGD